MTTHHSRLANGLQIVTSPMAEAYSATVAIYVGVGSRYERFETQGGITHFLEHLLFKGTSKRPSTKIISEQIDAVGGRINAYTSTELTTFYARMPYQHTALGLDILADMLRHSLLESEEIDRERDVVLEEMNVYRDEPASYVHQLTPPLLWPDHPLANPILGNEEVIRSASRTDIAEYLAHHYQPHKLVVVAAGRVDHDAIVKQTEQLFGDMPSQPFVPATAANHQLATEAVATHIKDTAQAHLTIGTVAYPYRHANDTAARLIAAILGHGLSSRLFLNIREKLGLAYSISAGTQNYVDTGEFEVYAGVSVTKQAEAITAIMRELRLITEQPVGAEELAKAKNQLRGGLQMAMESNGAVADRLGTQQVLLGDIRSVAQVLAEIDAVSAADITRVAAEMLAPGRLKLGIISPDPSPAAQTFQDLINS